ncbi:hypothetical protein N480_01090 [Pseudoalteromonas luteoviolacea S2607]|uniref:hypothetical protein n=1 Tax=Pseudoalteromonas luteoviolacea TaxID=43657 RepID=UPI0007B07EE3|nr:hypothetical protein [Pseudoalteromonas luteoviolacea]KZN39457.1 hypothetical protein N480_01090 [Pseudoalteromonas luteoviolacea S2607]
MKKSIVTLLTFLLSFPLTVKAQTTWIPISNGGIFFVIPFIPSVSFPPATNFNTNIVSGESYVTWADIEHASKYQIQVLNSQGQWVDLFIVNENKFLLSKLNGNYEFRVIACNMNTCENTGQASISFAPRKKVAFIHTDLLGSPVAETQE